MSRQLAMILEAEGFDALEDRTPRRRTRSRTPHIHVPKTPKNTRLHVPAPQASAIDALGDKVTVGFSTVTCTLVIAPLSAGFGTKRNVIHMTNGAAGIDLGPYHAELFARYGSGNVPVTVESRTLDGTHAVVIRTQGGAR